MAQVIVVGGGLAGLSAAHTVLEAGGRVVLLDKSAFMGGNSTKATSGINGALTKTQMRQGVPDSPELFEQDTLKGATGLKHSSPPDYTPPLAHVLTHDSGPAVDWLIERFGLDLSLVTRLGGHSQPRTHRGTERFPGFTITYALMERLEEIEEATQGARARIICKAEVNKLLTDGNGAVVGAQYMKDGQAQTEMGSVILATGGFGADFSPGGILARVRPDLAHFPTTNGEHCTGDGIKIAEAIGATCVDLESVQVHPTGLVHPEEPDSKVKFLAAEALRGVGGILLDANGNRFCNELGTRDYVSGEMFKNKAPFRLVLNGKASKEIEWHCKHYTGRRVMKHMASGADLAREIGVPPERLAETFAKYNEAARTEHCPFGKKFFSNLPLDMGDFFHSAIVTPVVHYTMGGLRIDEDGRVMNHNGPIANLYAAGELAGGIHGRNRLGGNSLLDCVVFGRVTGRTASREQFSTLVSNPPVASAAKVNLQLDPTSRSIQISWGSEGGMEVAPALAALKLTEEEVAKHNKEDDVWCILNGKVYDCTKFLPDHPGGKKAIMVFAGKDASEEFNMLHAPNVLKKYLPAEACLGEVGASSKM
jgi:flavocytochrome c